MTTVDIRILDEGTLVGFKAISDEASDWIHENVHSEPWQWLGGTLWVDHRFAPMLLDGIAEAGFEVAR
jgi:hypothetical protein